MDFNKWVGIGRLTRDAEISYLQTGTAKVNFAIACNRRKDKDGNEAVDYFDVTVWGKMAENLKGYLIKGKQIAITGRLQQDRWQSDDGAKHTKVSIVAEDIQLLGGTHVPLPQQQGGGYPQQQPQQQWGGYQQQQGNPYPQQYQQAPQQQQGNYASGGFPDDIPF